MTGKNAILILALLAASSSLRMNCIAQGATNFKQKPTVRHEIQSLNIGDKVPDVVINQIVNYPKPSARLSDFKGKLLILDFWETGCGSCIEAMPKIQQIQEEFGDKVQVVTVTRFSKTNTIFEYLRKFAKIDKFILPTVIKDDILFKYFPYATISHVVWINQDGELAALTGTEHIKREYVQELLKQKKVDWPIKKEINDFDWDQPFLAFSNKDISKPNFFFYSTFMGAVNGVAGRGSIKYDSVNNTKELTICNTPLIDICKGAIKGELTGDYDLKEVILEVKDKNRYDYETNRNGGYYWYSKGTISNIYSYSIILPGNLSEEEERRVIAADISRWLQLSLGITIRKQPTEVPCLNIRASDANATLRKISSSPAASQRWIEAKDSITLSKFPFKDFILFLNAASTLPFVFNETSISDSIDIDMKISRKSLDDLQLLRSELNNYGLNIQEVIRSRDMYIITEKEYNKN